MFREYAAVVKPKGYTQQRLSNAATASMSMLINQERKFTYIAFSSQKSFSAQYSYVQPSPWRCKFMDWETRSN